MRNMSFEIVRITSAALMLLAATSAAEADLISPAAPGPADAVPAADEQLLRSSKPVGLHITLCLWSQSHPDQLCREVALTPGAAGRGFDDQAACEAGKARALNDWFEQARPVFGFHSGWAGDGYQIKSPRCVALG